MSSKGKPSGINKSAGTGTPSNFKPGRLEQDNLLTQRYTDDDKKIAEQVRIKKPNRNAEKQKITNIHDYRGKKMGE